MAIYTPLKEKVLTTFELFIYLKKYQEVSRTTADAKDHANFKDIKELIEGLESIGCKFNSIERIVRDVDFEEFCIGEVIAAEVMPEETAMKTDWTHVVSEFKKQFKSVDVNGTRWWLIAPSN